LSCKNLSRPLWRPLNFTAIQLLKTATFEESGRDGGHLAILDDIIATEQHSKVNNKVNGFERKRQNLAVSKKIANVLFKPSSHF
jgi:hypothetical protein